MDTPRNITEHQTGAQDVLLTIGLSSPEHDSVLKTLAHSFGSVRSFESMDAALHAVFYDDYDICIIHHDELTPRSVFYLHEAHQFCPWRGIVILCNPDNFMTMHEETGFFCLNSSNMLPVNNYYEEVINRKKKWLLPLTAERINHFLQMFNIMRASSLTAIQQHNLLNALNEFVVTISSHLNLYMIGISYCDDAEHFLLLHLPRHTSTDMRTEVTQALIKQLQMMEFNIDNMDIELRSDANLHPLPEHFRISMFPIIIENHLLGYLAITMEETEHLRQLYYSFLVHIIHYVSMIFADLLRLRELALKDPLTRLYNRRYMEEAVERLFLLGRRHGHAIAVLFIDVDHFKQLNDQYGHETGDLVLMHIARLFESSLRQSDIAARYGGDEFVIILPHTNDIEALNTAKRIAADVAKFPLKAGSADLFLSLSIGVSLSTVTDRSEHVSNVIRRADEAMLHAKNNGGDQVQMWLPNQTSHPVTLKNEPINKAEKDVGSSLEDDDETLRGSVLIIDDEQEVLNYVGSILEDEGYETATALSGDEAIRMIQAAPSRYDLMVVDLNMPEINGFDLIRHVKQINTSIINVIIAGDMTTERAILALRNGAYDVLTKPFGREQLLLSVNRALQYHHVCQENKRYQQQLLNVVNMKSSENRRSLELVKTAYESTLDTMVDILDAREQYTSNHSVRVRDLTVLLARKMKLKASLIKEISQGALLHDIGKIGIPDAILMKPGELTAEERTIMETHPQIGFSFLEENRFLQKAAELIFTHHERWNGSGYPSRLRGTAIPIGARIFAVIDSYDAIRSERCYKPVVPAEEAMRIIQAERGILFDPDVVDAFTEYHHEIEELGNWLESP